MYELVGAADHWGEYSEELILKWTEDLRRVCEGTQTKDAEKKMPKITCVEIDSTFEELYKEYYKLSLDEE